MRLRRPVIRSFYLSNRTNADLIAEGLAPESVLRLTDPINPKAILVAVRSALDSRVLTGGH